MNIAIIPARGGSKRIPHKNIKDFCGKPMIAWSIEVAQNSKLFDHIIVSTDDAEISEVAKTWGAEAPFIRPANLSDDFTGTDAVVRHALEWCLKELGHVSNVCTIYATAPFISVEDLIASYALLCSREFKIVFSATTFPFPIQRAIGLDTNEGVKMFQPQHYLTRSQDLEASYHDAAQFYWARAQAVLDAVPAFSAEATLFILPRYKVQDIDNEDDWVRAELMFKAWGQHSYPTLVKPR